MSNNNIMKINAIYTSSYIMHAWVHALHGDMSELANARDTV